MRISCITLFLLVVSLALSKGATDLNLNELMQALLNASIEANSDATIFFLLRLPRVIIAGVCGALLASAGVLSQGYFRNPLASPSIIGTTAGGAALASLTILFGISPFGASTVPVAAFLGCMLSTLLMLKISYYNRSQSNEIILITGLALSTLFSAITMLATSLALEEHQRLQSLMQWLLGSIDSRPWGEILPLTAASSIVWLLGAKLTRPLDVLSLGDEVSHSLGVNISRLQLLLITCIAATEALSLSLAGALTFVGLIVPHITRQLIGPLHRSLYTYSALNGATLLIGADLLARTLRSPAEIPVGALVALLGAGFFLYLVFAKWGRPS